MRENYLGTLIVGYNRLPKSTENDKGQPTRKRNNNNNNNHDNKHQLSHSSEYNMTNIFRVSHILPQNIQQNMGNEENIGHIVRDKRAITSLSLTYKISTICSITIYQGK